VGPQNKDPGQESLEDAHRRLSTLYEISKLLTRIESAESTVRAIITLMTQAQGLRGAVVIFETADGPVTITDSAPGPDTSAREAYALQAYAFLTGTGPEPQAYVADAGHVIMLPVVGNNREVFGVLLAESSVMPSEQELIFVNAVVNQLAIALEWRTIVEARQAGADSATVRAQAGRAIAEQQQDRFQALAAENARLLHLAEEASRARDHLLAVVSHDLRNQLNAILMSIALLLRKRPVGSEERRASRNMSIIQRAAQGMDHLIGDLLDVASIESGRMVLSLQPVEIGVLVQGAVELLDEQAASRSIRFTSTVEVSGLKVLCDRRRIQQALVNVIGNALKFTPTGGEVALRVNADGDAVRFTVNDTGSGIEPDELAHVFDRFWRGSHATAAGTGLGLAIVKGVIERHGGTIRLESQVGVGTTVTITVPCNPSV
jgi:signal transduction histidine kinase